MHNHYRETFAAGWAALEKRLLPSYVWTSDPLTFWRERILFLICFIAAVLGPIALVPSLLLAYREGLWIVILVDSLAYMAAVTILIARNASFVVRALVICFIPYALGVCILFILGPVGAGYIWLFGASVLISAFIGLGAAIWTLAVNTIALLSVGIFIAYGNPTWILHVDNALEKWLVMSANFLLLNALITITTAFMLNGLKTAVLMEQKISKSLRESELLFRKVFKDHAAVKLIVDPDTGNVIDANKAATVFYGWSHEQLIQMKIQEINTLSPEEIKLEMEKVRTDKRNHFEFRHRRADGSVRDVDVLSSKIEVIKKDLIHSIIYDITDRKQAESKLREAYEIINGSPVVAFLWKNAEGWPVEFVTDNVEVLSGYKAEELISGKVSYSGTVHPDDLERVAKEVADYNKDKGSLAFDHEPYRIVTRDGKIKWVNDSTFIRRNEKGEITHYQGILFDITDRKQAEEQLKNTLEGLRKAVSTTIQVIISTIEARDPYTTSHQIRSADLARAIATEMNLPQDRIEGIHMAGSIHDIGKISIPAEILSKPTKLSEIEFSLIKEHARSGFDILKVVESPWPLAEIVYQHHERMDGSGYPRNLKGDEILMEARILAVCDVVESMASHRPYRASLGIDAALKEIENNRGGLYDADVVNVCLRLFREKGFTLEKT